MLTELNDKITLAADAAVKKFKSSAIEYKEGKDALISIFTDEVSKNVPEADPNTVLAITTRALSRVNLFEKSDADKRRLKEMKAEFKRQLK